MKVLLDFENLMKNKNHGIVMTVDY